MKKQVEASSYTTPRGTTSDKTEISFSAMIYACAALINS
jgi:hypothetical protein